MQKLKIGIVGVGHLGKLHLTNLLEIPDVHISGIYDTDAERMNSLSSQYNVRKADSLECLLSSSEAVSIVTPTSYHFQNAKTALEAGKHVFIEKPITTTEEEGIELAEIARNRNLKIQVGHIERFNPAFVAAQSVGLEPKFIEAHRLASFNPRGTDVAVILDLMIHDIDLALSLIKSPVSKIDASGVGVISEYPDIANARLQFENGAVANLTASRISQKKMRKMRIFQPNTYITADFLERSAEIYQLTEQDETVSGGIVLSSLELNGKKKKITYAKPFVKEDNALLAELTAFKDAVMNDTVTKVTAEEAIEALRIANTIVSIANQNYERIV